MSAYVTVAVSTLGAVFIALTVYRIARRDPRPTFNVEGNRVVSSQGAADHPLEIRYDEERVDRVTRSVVTFWNGGRGTIKGSELTPGHPVTFTFSGDVLAAAMIGASRPECLFKLAVLEERPRVVSIGFHHVDRGDGCKIEVTHTGRSWSVVSPEVGGVPGTKGKIRERMTTKPRWWGPVFLADLIAFLILVYGFMYTILYVSRAEWIIAVVIAVGAVATIGLRMRLKSRYVPKWTSKEP